MDRTKVRARVEAGHAFDDVTELGRDARVASRLVVSMTRRFLELVDERDLQHLVDARCGAGHTDGGALRERLDDVETARREPRADAGDPVVGNTEALTDLVGARVLVIVGRPRVVDARDERLQLVLPVTQDDVELDVLVAGSDTESCGRVPR